MKKPTQLTRRAPASALFSATTIIGMALFLMVAPSWSESTAAAPQQQGPMRIEVDLVTVPVSVVDRNNRPISDLKKEDFEIFDEDKKQTITLFEAETHQPLDLALMMDSSMSTSLDFESEREAVVHF